MDIKTKFKLKDKIWAIRKQNKLWVLYKRQFIIVGFAITPNYWSSTKKEKKEVIFKNFRKSKDIKDCFATKEEAQAECDKRNKGE